jgi:hypothetical protein
MAPEQIDTLEQQEPITPIQASESDIAKEEKGS